MDANKNKENQPPPREDGRAWTNQMHEVARLRAQGRNWIRVSELTDLAHSTVQGYPSRFPPFETKDPNNPGLVEWYREKLHAEEFREHWAGGELDALRALRAEFDAERRKAQRLADRLDDDDLDDEERQQLQSRLSTASRAVVQAAREYLSATGRAAYRNERAKLKAQEEVTGEPGERVNVSLNDLDGLDAEQLSKLYQQTRSGE